MTLILTSIATMKLTLATLLTVQFLITILSVGSGSPKPEFKTIIHLDEELTKNKDQEAESDYSAASLEGPSVPTNRKSNFRGKWF